MAINYTRADMIQMKGHPELSETWVQNIVASDTSLLGLGKLKLIERERTQPRAGRLDLLLEDSRDQKRYEVEIQLGSTDESHIIRTIEYWDIERKRHPRYDHCAVLVAEDVTRRFLNVISLFNRIIPLVVIRMQAVRVGEHTTLVFTTVVDERSWEVVEDDDDIQAEPNDREYWENRASSESLEVVDRILTLIQNIDPAINLKYGRRNIGLQIDNQPYNFIKFVPRINHTNLVVFLPQSKQVDQVINSAGLDTLPYKDSSQCYRLRLSPNDIDSKSAVLGEIIQLAHDSF